MSAGAPVTFDAYVGSRRARVERALEGCLPGPPACPRLLSQAMRYSLLGGGKRFRPVLTLAAAEASVGADEVEAALPAACAVELIHTYSLIHDDLPAMDDDTMRRGHPTSHVVFGEGLAILAGDALLTEAFALLARDPGTTEGGMAQRQLRALALLAEAAGAAGMVGGQTLDLAAAGQCRRPAPAAAGAASEPVPPAPLDAACLADMHARKTGALIRAAATVGAVMAGAPEPAIAAIATYATEVGLAFQIVDDVLDVAGAAADLGKTTGKDAAAGKPTYPAVHGVVRSKQLAREAVDRALAALASAGVGGRLGEIARWVVTRSS